jgi:PAS domain S-box-containing protein
MAGLIEKKELSTGRVVEMIDGRVFEQDFIPIYIENKYKGHLWSYTDITEKKKSQDAIAKSELTNRLILNAALDAIVIINDKSEITFWNPNAEKIFGWKENEVKGKTLTNTIIPPEFRKAHLSGMANFHQTGDGPVLNKLIELTAINRQGELFPIELSIVTIRQDAGIFFCGFIRDISARKRAETELKASQELWQFALEGAGDGVTEYDFETNEIFFSQQYKNMMGYDENEFENKANAWIKTVHRDDREIIEKCDQDYIDQKIISHQLEYRIRDKKGDYHWILDRGKVIRQDADGKPKRIIGTHTEITARKKAEEEYKRISLVASANENGVLFTMKPKTN